MKIDHPVSVLTVLFTAVFAACGTRSRTETTQREVGTPVEDAHLQRLLQPEATVQRAGLSRTADGNWYYEAHLAGDAGDDYLGRYKELIGNRGVLIEALGSSPHAVPPRILGWLTTALRPGTATPFTIYVEKFKNRSDEQLRGRWNAPEPLTLENGVLRFDLGRQEQPWTEEVILPSSDLQAVTELPLARFPGAVLKEVYVPDGDQLLSATDVDRHYTVTGASVLEILRHYRGEAQRLGIPAEIEGSESAGFDLIWSNKEKPVHGIVRLWVEEQSISPGFRATLSEARAQWPHLFGAFPRHAVEFKVMLWMAKSDDAASYWTAEAQARRASRSSVRRDPRAGQIASRAAPGLARSLGCPQRCVGARVEARFSCWRGTGFTPKRPTPHRAFLAAPVAERAQCTSRHRWVGSMIRHAGRATSPWRPRSHAASRPCGAFGADDDVLLSLPARKAQVSASANTLGGSGCTRQV